ncbi:hypothetical protein MXL82_02315 [Staphylococcus gallinarum]|uniref:hypothetical protein n=1 Tax=Staphylococcus TaxID=1279 RepID=UPI000D1EACA7|nr:MULTISPECIES: hypothetical protein [Staphylococcus]MEB6241877.1 hypothetical protein [Staphylococcus gallinarum]MEB6295054.1 hypothetical protein [Staphylococcus gallinarum]PTJ81250.1 hypothetical protein BU055_11470 [Staphylococcus succinus]
MSVPYQFQINSLESALESLGYTSFLLREEVTKFNTHETSNQFYILYLINDLKNLYRMAQSYINSREELFSNPEVDAYGLYIYDLEQILQSPEFNKNFLDSECTHMNEMHEMSKRHNQLGEALQKIREWRKANAD